MKRRAPTRAWVEQLQQRAEKALLDIDEMLTYDLEERDGKMVPVSRISEGTRAKLNMFLIENHPESAKSQHQPAVTIEISGEVALRASKAARELPPAAPVIEMPKLSDA